MASLTSLQLKIYNLLRKIPKDKVTTYKTLAKAVGKPKNWREIGKILSQNPCPDQSRDPDKGRDPSKFPCYKVVRSDGKIGGYSGGINKKKKLLQKDGIIIINNKIRNFKKVLFKF